MKTLVPNLLNKTTILLTNRLNCTKDYLNIGYVWTVIGKIGLFFSPHSFSNLSYPNSFLISIMIVDVVTLYT